ncbi:MAG: ferredoxin [Pyrinomonadaceae bacterium]|nr:ferredoxin [Pyrinomonadaceae bacterium]
MSKRHPLNAEGKFWIDQDVCLACSTCFDVDAPQNIKYDIETNTSFVFKQPENDEELGNLRMAIDACCVEAIIED